MTITTDYSPVQYNGNGVTTSFAFPYTFYDDTDLIVTTTVVATGVDTVRVLNTDYTVTGGDGANGTVVFGTAPASGVRVTIEVDIPYRQEDDYVENQAFPADTLEQSLDRAVIRDQQLKSAVDRSIKFPATLAGSLVGLLPQPVDGKLLVWDGTSGQIGNADIANVSSTLNTIITTPVSGQVLTWNGTNWINSNVPQFTVATSNINMAFVYKLENMANPFNPQDAATKAYVDGLVAPILRNHIDGYQMSTAGSSTTMTIGAGQAANSTNAVYITLVSSLNKTTSSWAVGTGNGGLDTGTIANNTWYHFYAIRRPDTGVVDVVFSTNATSPTLPTNYTQFRRIGARRTNGSGQWDSFTQIGDLFIINTPILDVNDGASGTTDKTGTLTNVPTGVNTLVNANVSIGNNGNNAYISALSSAAAAPSLSAAPLTSVVNVLNGTSATPYPVQFLADTNAQFRYRTLSSSTFLLSVLSYVDLRGKQ